MDIRAERVAAGLSQSQLARAAGVPQPNLSAYENDRRAPSPEVLDRIRRALTAPPSQRIEQHRDEIRALVAAHHASAPRVFGSVARGDDRLFNLTAELTRLLGTAVDVVSDRGLRSRDDQIRAEAVAL